MQIESERLLLRRFRAGDWKDLHEYLSDPEVVFFEPYGVFTPEESKREASRRAGDEAFWAVCKKAGGKLIGNLYLGKQDFGAYELGYVFNNKYQGLGYATESVAALIRCAFASMGARRVVAMCNPDNEKSWRLLERLGMRREGHLKRNIFFKTDGNGNPVWVDTYMYAVLGDEWLEAGGSRPDG